MHPMVNESAYNWTMRSLFFAGIIGHIAYFSLVEHRLPPQGPSFDLPEWIAFLWPPVATGAIVFGLFRLAFVRWLWRWWPCSLLVRFPCLTGTWFATSDSASFGSVHHSVVTIDHRFGQVVYFADRPGSHQWSLSAALERPNHVPELFVVYRNNPGNLRDVNAESHMGCLHLVLRNENFHPWRWQLRGAYWTDRNLPLADGGRGGSYGTIVMTRESQEILDQDAPEAVAHIAAEPIPNDAARA